MSTHGESHNYDGDLQSTRDIAQVSFFQKMLQDIPQRGIGTHIQLVLAFLKYTKLYIFIFSPNSEVRKLAISEG